jgi:hypothetical protein
MWAGPGYAQCWVLFDRNGGLAQLKARAAAYNPASLRAEADAWISGMLMDNTEEATKILGALQRSDEGAALYGMLGIEYNLNLIAALHLGLLIDSENNYLCLLQQAAPSEWTRLQRVTMGFEPASITRRAHAALGLYRFTCRWLDALILPQHRAVIEYVYDLIPPEWESS